MNYLDDEMKEIVEKAVEGLYARNQNVLKPEHVIYEILEGENEVSDLIDEMKISKENLIDEVEELVESSYGYTGGNSSQPYFSSEITHVFESSRKEARMFKSRKVGVVHFFLATLKETSLQVTNIFRKY